MRIVIPMVSGADEIHSLRSVVRECEAELEESDSEFRCGIPLGVLLLVENVCRAARAAGKLVSVCGELASDPQACELLLKVGVTGLSVPPLEIPRLKVRIRDWINRASNEG